MYSLNKTVTCLSELMYSSQELLRLASRSQSVCFHVKWTIPTCRLKDEAQSRTSLVLLAHRTSDQHAALCFSGSMLGRGGDVMLFTFSRFDGGVHSICVGGVVFLGHSRFPPLLLFQLL
ncbi:hypothetical protein CRENBAI_016828 [Crenichthys baileyi]|uniref:Uncharacterized protein n=1 Tax=Crenichthys baileyi TaxID=28760 RepID=A0AAV9RF85_9TELE